MRFTQPFHETATNDELIALCSQPLCENIIYDIPGGNTVIKISDQAVIKFGEGLEKAEANNQRRAYELISHKVVRIPRVYRFFTHGPSGYLVMEYIHGEALQMKENSGHVRKVAQLLSKMADIPEPNPFIPGPLCGGPPRGLLWPENEDYVLGSIQDLEGFVNRRLHKNQTLVLGNSKLILCHLDVAPRNILCIDDDSICLLDWYSAGFYPKCFAICSQRIGKDEEFNKQLQELMGSSEEEEAQATLVHEAWNNSQRHYYSPLVPSRNTFVSCPRHEEDLADNCLPPPPPAPPPPPPQPASSFSFFFSFFFPPSSSPRPPLPSSPTRSQA